MHVDVLGGGLAGSEAAYQIAERGIAVTLHEMRPVVCTPAHQTDRFAELVCSNSLKSDQPPSASWLLKEELRRLGSLCMGAASAARVPGGQALTVDREVFAEEVTRTIERHPRIEIVRGEVTAIPRGGVVVIATGPLTGDALAADIARVTGSERLYFYDSISPIVDGDTVDMAIAFRASRYDKSLDGTGDYLNCPFTREEYDRFYDALGAAQSAPSHVANDLPSGGDVPYFESCLPIEELARRGRDTLRFGPMKPVGLTDPRTGRYPYACVQLRRESLRSDSWNLVGFQNHLRFAEQKRVLRLIPGLQNAEFLRYGQIHRNTYINAPALLRPTLEMKANPDIFFAGQISGVEGYVESVATGLLAGMHAAARVCGSSAAAPPRETALGSLCNYIAGADPRNYQPANIAFDLFPVLDVDAAARFKHDKKARHTEICRRALDAMEQYQPAYV